MNYSDRSDTLILDNDQLRVAVMPQVGGTITSIQHKGLNASVLGSTPWDPIPFPLASCAAPNEDDWLTRYGGGWPLLFPNGGDAGEFSDQLVQRTREPIDITAGGGPPGGGPPWGVPP